MNDSTITLNKATVDIADAFAEAQRMPVHAIVLGDRVFDTTGGSHELTGIQVRRVRGSKTPFVWIKRDDGYSGLWEPWCFLDEEVTVIPNLSARETQEV